MTEIYDLIEYEDLPYHYRIVADSCGMTIARELIKQLAGFSINIPPLTKMPNAVIRYCELNPEVDNKQLALIGKCSYRTIYRYKANHYKNSGKPQPPK